MEILKIWANYRVKKYHGQAKRTFLSKGLLLFELTVARDRHSAAGTTCSGR